MIQIANKKSKQLRKGIRALLRYAHYAWKRRQKRREQRKPLSPCRIKPLSRRQTARAFVKTRPKKSDSNWTSLLNVPQFLELTCKKASKKRIEIQAIRLSDSRYRQLKNHSMKKEWHKLHR